MYHTVSTGQHPMNIGWKHANYQKLLCKGLYCEAIIYKYTQKNKCIQKTQWHQK